MNMPGVGLEIAEHRRAALSVEKWVNEIYELGRRVGAHKEAERWRSALAADSRRTGRPGPFDPAGSAGVGPLFEK
jgi:hypothetical protein